MRSPSKRASGYGTSRGVRIWRKARSRRRCRRSGQVADHPDLRLPCELVADGSGSVRFQRNTGKKISANEGPINRADRLGYVGLNPINFLIGRTLADLDCRKGITSHRDCQTPHRRNRRSRPAFLGCLERDELVRYRGLRPSKRCDRASRSFAP